VLKDVLERIERACTRSGRDPREVTLIAVTKGHTPEEIQRAVLGQGHRILGENRIQEWREKAAVLEGVAWHFIGTLQRNKVKYCLPFEAIHSLNSPRLADELEKRGEKDAHTFRVFIEVNVAGEASKQGVSPKQALELVRYARSLPHLEVLGLMTMAPYSPDPEAARPHFRALRALRDRLGLKALSMGMSGDFEVAVEEGATHVRVGSAIFDA
jgi:pyridoxal phosphate enzyme (YggS family)